MINTILFDNHVKLGAKMVPFAGYNMPVSYTSIIEEHLAVRNAVGLFDVSHMGEFIVKGKDAEEFLQRVTSNDVNKLEIGQVQYSCFPNLNGGIIDDLLVYRLDETRCSDGEKAYMLVVNASNIEKDWNWLEEQKGSMELSLEDISEKTGLIALQGPKATSVLGKLTTMELNKMVYYHFEKGTVAGISNVLVSATGYTGAGGFEIYAKNEDLIKIWEALIEAGQEYGLKPSGLGCRDTLRLEMGFCLYGNDIDDTTSPLEAGLGWITKLDKGPFNSSDIFMEQKAQKVTKKLVGFVMEDRRVPRKGYPIYDESDSEIGVVTSGTLSPSLDTPIGMGYVKSSQAKKGTSIWIGIGEKRMKAKVVNPPFINEE
ncbi:MAG: glycine cleavage system aminomethyltransferase GcvT [Saprospiraceae bacterium]|jgi:aminomethyltransferase|nr:glycine cleavage system aminomethyltransferase GcvT [Saprospiraceae bacterium]